MTANAGLCRAPARRLAPVLLAAVLLPATMPIASASFTQRLGVDTGVSVAAAPPVEEEAPDPPVVQADSDPPTGPPEAPAEPVVEPPKDTGASPAVEQPTGAPDEAPKPRERTRKGKEADEGCPQTGCAQGGDASPPARDTPAPGDATPPAPPTADQSPEDTAVAAQADVRRNRRVRPQ